MTLSKPVETVFETTGLSKGEEVLSLSAKGQDGQIEINSSIVTIHRKGMLAKMNKGLTTGDRRIPIGNITAVQFKAAGLTSGYIRFSVLGSVDRSPGVLKGQRDENQVQFITKHQPEFEAIRDRVEAEIIRRPNGHSPSSTTPTTDVAEQIRKLAQLRDEGILSDDEFQGKKKQLLGL